MDAKITRVNPCKVLRAKAAIIVSMSCKVVNLFHMWLEHALSSSLAITDQGPGELAQPFLYYKLSHPLVIWVSYHLFPPDLENWFSLSLLQIVTSLEKFGILSPIPTLPVHQRMRPSMQDSELTAPGEGILSTPTCRSTWNSTTRARLLWLQKILLNLVDSTNLLVKLIKAMKSPTPTQKIHICI